MTEEFSQEDQYQSESLGKDRFCRYWNILCTKHPCKGLYEVLIERGVYKAPIYRVGLCQAPQMASMKSHYRRSFPTPTEASQSSYTEGVLQSPYTEEFHKALKGFQKPLYTKALQSP